MPMNGHRDEPVVLYVFYDFANLCYETAPKRNSKFDITIIFCGCNRLLSQYKYDTFLYDLDPFPSSLQGHH